MDSKHLKKIACEAIDQVATDLNSLSDDIWSHPELSFQEKYSHDAICSFLEKQGLPVERNYVLDTAFKSSVGEYEENQAHVSVLCEYDALPEIGHACGHNLIAECGVAAGIGIKAAMDNAGRNIGKLTVMGTPAEEGGNGKQILIDAGAFNNVTCSLMAHPAKFNIVRKPWLATQLVTVKYNGKASHAAAFPWEGVNALDAAVMAYQSVSVLRQQMKPSWRVHAIISNGGAKPNIFPEETELKGQIRNLSEADLIILRNKVQSCFEAAAKATGCQVEIDWDERPYLNVVTNNTLGDLYEKNATQVGVVFDGTNSQLSASTMSTDMGNVSHKVPSIHPVYSIGSGLNHTREFTKLSGKNEAQGPTLQTAKALAMTAIDIFLDQKLANQMKTDFAEDMKRDDH